MHGRPRPPKDQPEDPEKKKIAAKRLALCSRLCNEVLERRAARRYDAESLALAGSLLEQNPETYTAWNFRREALQAVLQGDSGAEEARRAAEDELALTERCLRRNPKSYAAWFHRRWVVQHGHCALDRELGLIDKLLDADERNFHGWGYRHFVVKLAGVPAAAEEAYTAARIGQNFSNYSAWHARTALLQQLHASSRTVTLQQLLAEDTAPASGGSAASMVPTWALREEYALVQQAFFTDPLDQSAWMYHRWLLGGSLAHFAAARGTEREGAARQVLEEELAREAAVCEELLAVEPDRSQCKWPLLTLARLRKAQSMLRAGAVGRAGASAASDQAGRERAPEPGAGPRQCGETDHLAARSQDAAAGASLPCAAGSAGASARHAQEGGACPTCDSSAGSPDHIFRELLELDPLRRGYYSDELAQRARVVFSPLPKR